MINRKSGTVFRDLASANQGGAQGHRGYDGVACTVDMEVRFPLLISTPFDLSRRERGSCAVFPREARFPSNRVGAPRPGSSGSNDVNVGFAPLIGPGNSRYSICSSAVIGNGVLRTLHR